MKQQIMSGSSKVEESFSISLLDELLAIQDGECVYCAKGISHRSHSCCVKAPLLPTETNSPEIKQRLIAEEL